MTTASEAPAPTRGVASQLQDWNCQTFAPQIMFLTTFSSMVSCIRRNNWPPNSVSCCDASHPDSSPAGSEPSSKFPASAARHGNSLRHRIDICTDEGIRNACCPLIRRYLRTGERVACVKRIQTMNRGSSIGALPLSQPHLYAVRTPRPSEKRETGFHESPHQKSVPHPTTKSSATCLVKPTLEPQPPCNPSRIRGPWIHGGVVSRSGRQRKEPLPPF